MSVSVPTRVGPAGTADKLSLLFAEAERCSELPEIQALALRVCKGAGSRAQACVEAIEAWASQIDYRHEPKDRLRDPLQTAEAGGDCDDLTLLVGSLLMALKIPFEPEIVADDQCVAFHVRAVAGLPPHNPTIGYVIDPVLWTEREWNGRPTVPASRQTQWRGRS
jgi:hypothetical protein